MTSLFVTLSFFLFAGAAALAVCAAVSAHHRMLHEKLSDIAVKARVSQGMLEGSPAGAEALGRMLLEWAVRHMPAPRLDTPKGEKLVQTLAQAGFTRASAAHMFQTVRLSAAVAGAFAGIIAASLMGLPSTSRMLWIIAGSAVGAFIPSCYVGWRARARQAAIAKELSDALDLLVVCVEAGLGLHEAIKVVGNEAERQGQAIGHEMSFVAAEMGAGKSLGQALRAFSERTAVDDIKPLAATLIQSEQLGAQIAPALKSASDALRAKRRLRAEEEAQKTTVKILFPLVLFILPAMLIVIVGPAMIQILHTFSR
jgi:tight adherence protein C